MADLKFADYEKEFIAKNGVDTTYYSYLYDTSYFHGVYTDTLQTEAYDSLGNRIYYSDHNFWGTRITYKYNSLGLLTKSFGGSCVKTTTLYHYKLANDTLLVFESRQRQRDTILNGYYIFDESGCLKTGYNTIPETNYRPFIITYVYDDNRLVEISGVEKKTYKGFGTSTYTKHIYYTGNKPDSSIAIYVHNPTDRKSIKTTKIYYDNRGLKLKEIAPDGRTVHYKHILRK